MKNLIDSEVFQNILDDIEKAKKKLKKQLQALIVFQQQLKDFLSCKDL